MIAAEMLLLQLAADEQQLFDTLRHAGAFGSAADVLRCGLYQLARQLEVDVPEEALQLGRRPPAVASPLGAIAFTVLGTPQPKGSTRAFVRRTDYGTAAAVTSDNPRLAGWEELVRYASHAALHRSGLAASPFFDAPVAVSLVFGLVRPPSASVRSRPWPVVKPDLDKLARAAIDPLVGIWIRDDAQVVQLEARKRYVAKGAPACLDVELAAAGVPEAAAPSAVAPSLRPGGRRP